MKRRFTFEEVVALFEAKSISLPELREDATMQKTMCVEHSREVTLQAEELEAEAKEKREEAASLKRQAELLASAIQKLG